MAGEDVFPAWSCSVEETLSHLRVDACSAGLSEAEVKTRQEQYGLDELEHEEGTPFWKLVLEQFEDTPVRDTTAAAAVSFLLAYLDNQALPTRDLPLSGHGHGRAARWSPVAWGSRTNARCHPAGFRPENCLSLEIIVTA